MNEAIRLGCAHIASRYPRLLRKRSCSNNNLSQGGCNKISDTNVIKSIFFNFVKNTTPPPWFYYASQNFITFFKNTHPILLRVPKFYYIFQKHPPYFTTIFHYIFQKYPPVFWRVPKFYDIFQIDPPNFITRSKILLHFAKTPPILCRVPKFYDIFEKYPLKFGRVLKKCHKNFITFVENTPWFYYIGPTGLFLLHFSKWPPYFYYIQFDFITPKTTTPPGLVSEIFFQPPPPSVNRQVSNLLQTCPNLGF